MEGGSDAQTNFGGGKTHSRPTFGMLPRARGTDSHREWADVEVHDSGVRAGVDAIHQPSQQRGPVRLHTVSYSHEVSRN
jgi:hypothetical protein